jgi:ATP-dependent DNA helicase RecG
MAIEGQAIDKKSIRVLSESDKGFSDLAKDCVAFANAIGGRLFIGIEDDDEQPPLNQKIKDEVIEQLHKRISQLTLNVNIAPQKIAASNGGEYIELRVFRNENSIAGTSDGRYFLRIADETRPLRPDELTHLMNEKKAYSWETQTYQKIPCDKFDSNKRQKFLDLIRASDRVKNSVKEKSDDEILAHYCFTKDEFLTNLGVLWIGRDEDRATLAHAPVIQFIKRDETESKVNKICWDDFTLNPMELVDAVWREVPDWRESYELPDGMYRKNIPHYDERVVRELLVNALVHRPYTQRGDIFLNLFTDRLEIHNPGTLPLGVTPQNILHETVKRNEHLVRVCHDLKLMEREGSGYDMIYDVLLSQGKQIPEVSEGYDRVAVTIYKKIIKRDVIDFISKADETFHLKQRERIALGLIAQHESVTAIQLTKLLELKSSADLKTWIGRLAKWKIIKTKGRTKGTEYFVEPELLRKLNFKGLTTLKGIERHRLKALILEDLERYQIASIGDIHERIGKEIPRHKLKEELRNFVTRGEIETQGQGRWTKYLWKK